MTAAAGGLALPFVGAAARAQQTDLLRVALLNYPPILPPWVDTGGSALFIKRLMHRGLLGFDASGNVRGDLAESWSSDGDRVWNIKLRDAHFHNNKPVTPEDVKWSLEQVASEKSTAQLRGDLRAVEKIDIVDKKSLRITTKQPVGPMPQILASPYMGILSAESDLAASKWIGAGPFTLKAEERGISRDFEAFGRYFRPGLPKIKQIKATSYTDENLRVAALQSGTVDLIEYVPWQFMEGLSKDPKLTLGTTRGPCMYALFNTREGPFANALVRRAIAHAVKRDEIVKAAFFGRGAPLESIPIPESSEFYDPGRAKTWKYDPALAKSLLSQAGYPNGFTRKILSVSPTGFTSRTVQVVQQNLAEVGIKLEIVERDFPTVNAMARNGQYDMLVLGTAADNNDPSGLSAWFDGDAPPSMSRSFGYKNPKLDQLMAQGRSELNLQKRKAIYAEVEKLATEEAPVVFLCWRDQGYAHTNRLKDFRVFPAFLAFISATSLDEAYLA